MKRVSFILSLFLFSQISLHAQSITLSAESLTWEATQTQEQSIYLSSDSPWTLSFEGEGSEFICVAPSSANTSTSDITATLVVRAEDGSWAHLSLTHKAGSGLSRTIFNFTSEFK